uniref:Uncharacterized protein n=1 Tax=Nelumbo nucifera TaxID=4432 RepID=A0A822ZRV3_NELNU|nr:TPA_asm: hypothetical protein HUJ06_017540 [Nelumbo nucifera]
MKHSLGQWLIIQPVKTILSQRIQGLTSTVEFENASP